VIERSDALGRKVVVDAPARRVVSLIPSVTESLFVLGAGDRVAGCTEWCLHPKERVATVPKIGGTKNPDLAAIFALRPDLVLANKEENRRVDVEALAERVPVHISYPKSFDDTLGYMRDLGALLGIEAHVDGWVRDVEMRRAAFRASARARRRVAYFIWRKPWMVAAGDTYIDAMLREAGFDNVFAALPGRYPEIAWADVAAAAPDLVMLSSEPFPFAEEHRDEVAHLCGIPRTRVVCASGEAFSWFGVRGASVFDEAERLTRDEAES